MPPNTLHLVHTAPTAEPTALDAIQAVVGAEGDLDLAAERLYGPNNPRNTGPTPKARLISTIASDPTAVPELQKQLKVLTLLQAFQTTKLVGVSVDGTLHNQDPAVLAKLYTNLLSALASLTDDHTQNINANSTNVSLHLQDAVYRQLPPSIQEALKVLQAAPDSDPNVIDITQTDGVLDSPPPNVATDGVDK